MLLIPRRVRAGVLGLRGLLLLLAVEHVLEELELRGRWEEKEEQRGEVVYELHRRSVDGFAGA